MTTRTSQETEAGIRRARVAGLRRVLLVAGLVLAVCTSMALASAPAFAAKGVVAFYGGSGTEGGKFVGGERIQSTGGMAINQDGVGGASAGDLYVSDTTGNRVQVFTENGSFVRAFGLDVGGPGIDVCTVAADCVAGTPSGDAGGMSAPQAVAVDPTNGNVFVTDYRNNRMDVFSAMGVFEGAFGWDVKAVGGAEELQFCTTATGCKAGTAGAGAGQFAPETNKGKTGGITVSPVNGNILVTSVQNRRLDEFTQSDLGGVVTGVSFVRGLGWGTVNGAPEFQICTGTCHAPYPGVEMDKNPPPGEFYEPTDVAVDPQGTIYVSDSRYPRVERFAPDGSLLGPLVEGKSNGQGFESIVFDASTNHFLAYEHSLHQVSELDASGNVLETVEFGQDFFGEGTGVNEATGTIYVAGQIYAEKMWQFGVFETGTPTPPTASFGSVSPVGGTSATFHGTVNPRGLFSNFHFEYSANGHDWVKLQDGGLPGDSSDHAVTQTATGLEAHTQYTVRLVAAKILNGGGASAETTFSTGPASPIASDAAVSEISTNSATLSGTVNPENEATNYRFQCVTQSAYENTEWQTAVDLPPGGASISAFGGDVSVSQPFTGLMPSTRYRCRLIASNLTGSVIGGDISFVTYAAQGPGLPDGRVYEQATPVEKNGASVNGENYLVKAARDGHAITYFVSGGGNTGEGSQDFPTYVASLEGGNWVSHGLLPASIYGDRAEVKGWSEDLARDYPLVWNSGTRATFYMRENATGAMRPIATGLDPYSGAWFAGESADGDEVLFESDTALVPGAKDGVSNLYLWSRATGALTLVDVLPSGSASPTGGFAGSYNWAEQKLKAGGAEASQYTQPLNVLSADGSTAFFTSANVGQLYARRNLAAPNADTVQASASQRTPKDPQGSKPAAFMEATPDGRYVFFTSQSELTDDATTGGFNSQEVPVELAVEGESEEELEAKPPGGEFTLELGGAKTPSLPWTAEAAEVQARLEALPSIGAGNVRVRALTDENSAPYTGEEIGHRYVVSFIGALANATQPTLIVGGDGENGVRFGAARQLADAGNDLYRYDVRTGELVDIAPDQTDPAGAEVQAVLGSSDDGTDVYFIANGVLAAGATSGVCRSGPATGFRGEGPCNIYLSHDGLIRYVGPISGASEIEGANWLPTKQFGASVQAQRTGQVEGDTLVFTSTERITGYDNGGKEEIYRYTPSEGLTCVSCIPSGQSPPLAGAQMFGIKINFGAPTSPNPFLVRNVADGGRRVFFDSEEQLVATDINHVRDVYEWEADGTGSCSSAAQNGGCVYLISSGTSPEPSYFADASASGDDVFFFTHQGLVGQDTDELQDVYDAKVGGGIAAQNPQPVVPCSGEACKGSSPAAPEPAPAGTSQYVGPGNPKAPGACKKGFVRKGGKCVKKKAKKNHHKKSRHHKKKAHGKNNRKKPQAKKGTHR